jgi:hypothetical protein
MQEIAIAWTAILFCAMPNIDSRTFDRKNRSTYDKLTAIAKKLDAKMSRWTPEAVKKV